MTGEMKVFSGRQIKRCPFFTWQMFSTVTLWLNFESVVFATISVLRKLLRSASSSASFHLAMRPKF